MDAMKTSRTGWKTTGIGLSLMAAFLTAACSSDPVEPGSDYVFQFLDEDVVVIARSAPVDFGHDALFEGPVIADDTGCLRWDDEEGPTVVWPFGFTGEATTEGISILDADGTEVGRVGESFSLGGGIAPELLRASQEDRDLAAELCPGDYLIVAPAGAT